MTSHVVSKDAPSGLALPRSISQNRKLSSVRSLILVILPLLSWITAARGASPVVITQSTTIGCEDTTYEGMDIVIKGATVVIDCEHSFGSLSLLEGGVATHSAGNTNGLTLTVHGDLILDGTSRIDV